MLIGDRYLASSTVFPTTPMTSPLGANMEEIQEGMGGTEEKGSRPIMLGSLGSLGSLG